MDLSGTTALSGRLIQQYVDAADDLKQRKDGITALNAAAAMRFGENPDGLTAVFKERDHDVKSSWREGFSVPAQQQFMKMFQDAVITQITDHNAPTQQLGKVELSRIAHSVMDKVDNRHNALKESFTTLSQSFSSPDYTSALNALDNYAQHVTLCAQFDLKGLEGGADAQAYQMETLRSLVKELPTSTKENLFQAVMGNPTSKELASLILNPSFNMMFTETTEEHLDYTEQLKALEKINATATVLDALVTALDLETTTRALTGAMSDSERANNWLQTHAHSENSGLPEFADSNFWNAFKAFQKESNQLDLDQFGFGDVSQKEERIHRQLLSEKGQFQDAIEDMASKLDLNRDVEWNSTFLKDLNRATFQLDGSDERSLDVFTDKLGAQQAQTLSHFAILPFCHFA
ncbi:protein disulfide isomerase family protein, partial [Algicola sagamiensis]|uniref:hypothetical protein n=1 Tax=Algicola sagamiensis TaxID=163869 RepID=UPI000378C7AC